MSIPYAKRVQAETPTKIHVNNPTLAEARAALDFDVMGATTNPTFLKRLIGLEVDQDRVFAALDRIVATERDDHAAAEKLMIAMVGKLADLYMPVFEETKGRRGVVFIQGNPFRDGDADAMISEAERFFAIAPNIIVKLPSNFAGYRAFRELTAMGKPLCATSSLSLSQEETFFKAYNDIHGEDGKWPVLHVTSLAGILDEFTKKYAAEHGISLSEDALDKGGNLFTKLGYRMLREAGYRGTLLGGAARHFKHFTEMVGSDFESTLNHVFIRQLNDEIFGRLSLAIDGLRG